MRFKEAQQRQSLIFEEEEFECRFCGNFFTKTNTEHQPKSPPTTQVAQPEQKYLQLENTIVEQFIQSNGNYIMFHQDKNCSFVLTHQIPLIN